MEYVVAAGAVASTRLARDVVHHASGAGRQSGVLLSNQIDESAKEATRFSQWSVADDRVGDKFRRGPTDEWLIDWRSLAVPGSMITKNMPEDTITQGAQSLIDPSNPASSAAHPAMLGELIQPDTRSHFLSFGRAVLNGQPPIARLPYTPALDEY